MPLRASWLHGQRSGLSLLSAARAVAQAYHDARSRRRHIAVRVPQIRSALASAPPGFVFVVGNSHAEGTGIELDMLRPVADLRDEGEGMTTQAHPDGVHLSNYAPLAAKLAETL